MADVMLATYVGDELTPFSFEKSEEACRWAISSQLGHRPADEIVALALAKIYLETGRLKHCHKFNCGNIKASPKYEGWYTAFACNEVLQGKTVWFSPRGRLDKQGGVVIAERYDAEPWHPQTRFRSYANHWDGMDQYVTFIATGAYRAAWAKVLQGDAAGFVHALKVAGYFTADEGLYLAGVQSLYRELLARVKASPDVPIAPEVNHDELLACIKCSETFAHVA